MNHNNLNSLVTLIATISLALLVITTLFLSKMQRHSFVWSINSVRISLPSIRHLSQFFSFKAKSYIKAAAPISINTKINFKIYILYGTEKSEVSKLLIGLQNNDLGLHSWHGVSSAIIPSTILQCTQYSRCCVVMEILLRSSRTII
jgi:hypothetical protein